MASHTTIAEAVKLHVLCMPDPLPDRRVRVPYSIPDQDASSSESVATFNAITASLVFEGFVCGLLCLLSLHPLSSLKFVARTACVCYKKRIQE